jgi:hypothetical protein
VSRQQVSLLFGEGGRVLDTSPEERLALARQINGIEFEEYPVVAAAWLKAAGLEELRGCIRDDADKVLLDHYARGEAWDVESQRAMIRLFLREWLVCNVPENIGAWGLEVSEFRPISRDEALRAVDGIVAACQPDAEPDMSSPHTEARAYLAAIRGRGRDGAAADPPPAVLREWFVEVLFAQPGSAFFLHDSPGGETVRFNLANPRVIGLAPDLIGMLWQE